jgi:methionyl-tRNA synthetase
MSKSRGNFFDPNDVVAALGSDGARYVTLAEVAFDRDTEVSWESFIRRYNADLANDFGNLVNRTVSMANRYLAGERPPVAQGGSLRGAWERLLPIYREQLEGCLLHAALATLWEVVGAANRLVDLEKPWELAKAVKLGGADGEAAAVRLRGVLGDLVEACRLVGLAGAPVLPATVPRLLAQLGYAYPYGDDGNDGPPILDELLWGAHASEAGRLESAEPLFPRLDVEADATPVAR